MQIFIKGQNIEQSILVDSNSTLASLKQDICSQTLLSSSVTLSHNGLMLSDLSQLCENDNIYVTEPVLAGGAKHKKKVYTTKKKNKHRHIKEKLATLRYYSVDGSGKVVRNRKECPHCGVGFFMAKHMDRHYCGRCGLTLKLGRDCIRWPRRGGCFSKLTDPSRRTAGSAGGRLLIL